LGAAGTLPNGIINNGAILQFIWTPSAGQTSIPGTFTGVVSSLTTGLARGTTLTQLYGGQFSAGWNQTTTTIGNVKEHIGVLAKASILTNTGWGDCTGVLSQFNVSGITTRTNATCVKALPVSAINGTLTNQRGFWYKHVNGAQTIRNTIGFEGDTITRGTDLACSFMSMGHSVGSTACYGFQSLLHSAGTTRRSFIGANSFECTANHMIVGTSGMGFVVKDTVDGNFYMISTAGGVIGSSSIGATLPAI
jgi:hypothetical protein